MTTQKSSNSGASFEITGTTASRHPFIYSRTLAPVGQLYRQKPLPPAILDASAHSLAACSNYAIFGPLAETVLPGNSVMRPGNNLEWNSATKPVTNLPEAGPLIRDNIAKGGAFKTPTHSQRAGVGTTRLPHGPVFGDVTIV